MPTPTALTITEYFSAIRDMNIDRFVALFAPDAEQHDPVGMPPNIGQDAIRKFFAGIFSSFQSISLTEEAVFVNGTSAAAKWTGKVVAQDGRQVLFEGVDVIDCNDEGKIVMVRAFWDPAPVMALLGG